MRRHCKGCPDSHIRLLDVLVAAVWGGLPSASYGHATTAPSSHLFTLYPPPSQRAGGSKNELMALRKLLLAAESHRERGRRVPVELLNNIAALKHRAGDLDGALSVYTEALKEAAAVKGQRNAPVEESKISPSAPPAQRFCMKHGLPRSILCGATSATITFNIAALYDDKGDAATASSYLNELLRGYPTHADALARMGRIQERRYHVR